MKKILIGIFALILTVAVSAKDKGEKLTIDNESTTTVALSGTVFDSDSGELLAGVEVQIEGTHTKTYTDFDGNFKFENIKPGEYKLVTSYISYNKKIETLKIDSQKNQVKIQLENSK
jgi:hypothetical protein